MASPVIRRVLGEADAGLPTVQLYCEDGGRLVSSLTDDEDLFGRVSHDGSSPTSTSSREATAFGLDTAHLSCPPLELMRRLLGCRVVVPMRDYREFSGTLLGMDDYVNLLLADVTVREQTLDGWSSHFVERLLLNGQNITMIVPEGPEDVPYSLDALVISDNSP